MSRIMYLCFIVLVIQKISKKKIFFSMLLKHLVFIYPTSVIWRFFMCSKNHEFRGTPPNQDTDCRSLLLCKRTSVYLIQQIFSLSLQNGRKKTSQKHFCALFTLFWRITFERCVGVK